MSAAPCTHCWHEAPRQFAFGKRLPDATCCHCGATRHHAAVLRGTPGHGPFEPPSVAFEEQITPRKAAKR